MQGQEEKTSLDINEVQSRLGKLSLSRLESRIYIQLLTNGACRASYLAHSLNVNRVDVYRCLKNMRQRGLVEIVFSRPLLFSPAEPRLLGNILVSEQEQELKAFKKEVDDLQLQLEQISAKSNVPGQIRDVFNSVTSEQFTIKSGRQIDDKWKNMVDHSRAEMLVVLSRIGLLTHNVQGFFDVYARAVKRGVIIKMITDVVDENQEDAEEFSRVCNIRIAHSVNDSLRYVVADDREIMISMGSFSNNQKDYAAIWTNKALLIKAFRMDFRDKWRRARPFSAGPTTSRKD